jgi:transcription elongation factor GreA
MQGQPLSQKGHDKIKADLYVLVNVEQPRVREDIGKFREDGDLKENAPYHAAREELGMLEAKVEQLESILAVGFIVDRKRLPKDRVVFGTRVVVENKTEKKEEIYFMVGEGETNPDEGWILTTSPLGQTFMTKKVGETALAELPGGDFEYEIKEISFIEE